MSKFGMVTQVVEKRVSKGQPASSNFLGPPTCVRTKHENQQPNFA